MRIIPNYVYKFVFKSTLSALDGIYKVISIMSYAELINNNIDLFKATYEPNGITEAIFNDQLADIRIDQIYKIVSVHDDTNIQYIPEIMLAEIPDGSVQQYLHVGLAMDLGIFSDADQLSTIKSEIDQTVAGIAGISNSSLIYTVKHVWMTAGDYIAIESDRNAAISRVSNHFTDKVALQKQIDTLTTLVKYYEDTLKSL